MSSTEEGVRLLTDADISNGPSGRAVCTLPGCMSTKEYRDIRQHFKQHHNLHASVQFPGDDYQSVYRSKNGYFRCPRCQTIGYTTGVLQKHTRTCDAPPPKTEEVQPQPSPPTPVVTPPLTDTPKQRPVPERSATFPLPQITRDRIQEPQSKSDAVLKELAESLVKPRHVPGLRQSSSSQNSSQHRYQPYPSSNTPQEQRPAPRSHRSIPYPQSFHPSRLVQQHAPVSFQRLDHGPSLPSTRPETKLEKDQDNTSRPPNLSPSPSVLPSPINPPSQPEPPSDEEEEESPVSEPTVSDSKLTDDPMEGMQLMYPSSDDELEEIQPPRVPSPKPACIPSRDHRPPESMSPVSPLSPVSPISPFLHYVPRMPANQGNSGMQGNARIPTQGPLTPPPERTTFFQQQHNRRNPPPPVMSNLRHPLPSPVPSPQGAMHPRQSTYPIFNIPSSSTFAHPVYAMPQMPPPMPKWRTRYLQLSPELHEIFERPLMHFGITDAADIDILCTWHPDFHWRILRNWLHKHAQIGTLQWMIFRKGMEIRRDSIAASGSLPIPNPPIRPHPGSRHQGVSVLQTFEQILRRPLGEYAKILSKCGIRSVEELDMICMSCEDWDMLRLEFVNRGMPEFSWLLVQDGFKRWRAAFFPTRNAKS